MTAKLVCEKCGTKYEEYSAEKYITELNGNNYCRTCREFLKTKVKRKEQKKTRVKIHWSYYPLPNFKPAPNGRGYIKKSKVRKNKIHCN